jgi:hypothetical protein
VSLRVLRVVRKKRRDRTYADRTARSAHPPSPARYYARRPPRYRSQPSSGTCLCSVRQHSCTLPLVTPGASSPAEGKDSKVQVQKQANPSHLPLAQNPPLALLLLFSSSKWSTSNIAVTLLSTYIRINLSVHSRVKVWKARSYEERFMLCQPYTCLSSPAVRQRLPVSSRSKRKVALTCTSWVTAHSSGSSYDPS